MRAQHRELAHSDRRPVAVVTDSSADLSDTVLDRHHIALVPLQVMFGDEVFQDRVGTQAGGVLSPPADQPRTLPTTSQPTPADFVRVFRDARAEAEEVVAVLLAASLSGTYQSALGGAQGSRARPGCTWWTARRPRSGSVSWRCGPPSWRNRGGRQRESWLSSTGSSSSPARFITVDKFDNLIRSGESPGARHGWRECWMSSRFCHWIRPGASSRWTGSEGRDNVVPRVLSLAGKAADPATEGGPFRRGARRGTRGRRAGPYRPGRRLPASGLFRLAGHRGAGNPRRGGSVGGILHGRGLTKANFCPVGGVP